MSNRKLRRRFFYLGIPALAGFFLMYLFPFAMTLWYSVIDNTFRRKFIYFDNYASVFGNEYFQMAIKNTAFFSLACVTLITGLSLMLAFGLARLGKHFIFIRNLLVSPMLLPTASIVFAWQMAFGNDFYIGLARAGTNARFWTILPIYLLYIWKNTGINIIILGTAISGVPQEIHEAAAMDGAGWFSRHVRFTMPLITPSLVFVIVLSFVNSLKIFRESFLYFQSNYPPDVAYTVQFYMNNHFGKLNYPTLTAASVVFTVAVAAVVAVIYHLENRYNEKIY